MHPRITDSTDRAAASAVARFFAPEEAGGIEDAREGVPGGGVIDGM